MPKLWRCTMHPPINAIPFHCGNLKPSDASLRTAQYDTRIVLEILNEQNFTIMQSYWHESQDKLRHSFPTSIMFHHYAFFGTRFLNERSYTTSSTSLTLYFSPSLFLLRMSFFRLRI